MINRNIKRAVISGATGMIGAALCRELLAQGVEVYAVCRPASKRAGVVPKSEHIHLVECDLSSLRLLPQMITGGADAFFHFGWSGTTGAARNDTQMQLDNIRYTLDAARAASDLGCCVFVGAGSQAEFGRVEGLLTAQTPCAPENGYGMAKLCAGQMSRLLCKQQGIDHIWVRIVSIYGPGDGENTLISSAIRSLLAGQRPALTAGEQIWDYLFSEDAARAFDLLAKHGKDGSTYILGSGEASPLKEYVKILRDCINPALSLGFGEIPYAPQQVMHLQADITSLQNDTGFVPRVCFSEGIEKTINIFQKGSAL